MAETYETQNNAKIEGQIESNTTWPNFGIPQINFAEDISVSCDISDKLAEAVLTEYGLEYIDKSGASTGGDLTSLDVKRMDAMTLLNLSLIERAAKSSKSFIEPIMSSDGIVEFRQIGEYNAEISDIYYKIYSGSFVESPKAVMVTGQRPLPEMKSLSWYPIWGESPTRIYTTTDMLNNCRKQNFSRYSSIVFNDPQLTSSYEDGIDNLYEISIDNPWDRIIGYVKYINPGPLADQDTVVNYTNSSTVPLIMGDLNPGTNGPDMGILIERPTFDEDLFSPNCWSLEGGEGVDYTDGVKVVIPSELRYTTVRDVAKDKFVKIAGVYLVGKRIETLTISPIDESSSITTPTAENAKLIASIEKPDTTTIKLEEGKHFAVAYEDDPGEAGKVPYIVFAKDVLPDDPFAYGRNQKFYIDPTCEYATQNVINEDEMQTGTIFPHTKFRGILVQEIWVTLDIETPSISVYDPDGEGNKALEIAKVIEYYVAPLIVVEPPASIAYAGPSTGGSAEIVSQVPSTDTDPTTTEDFEDREIEIYMDEMQGGGMAITWSFLEEEDHIKNMADLLYEHFQSDVVETIYTCGPNCNPILGGYGENGGVVNSVRYNYTDGGSYTVSVTEGAKLVGNMAQIDGGPTMKMAENFSAAGVIIQVAGDNIHFKLRIDGYGERWAVNMAPTILRKGDIVQCTVHNNPVEA